MRFPVTTTAIVAAVVMLGCSDAAGNSVQFSDAVRLSAPTDVGTAPMFAVAPDGRQAVAWVSAPDGGTDGRLYVSVSGAAPVEIRDSLGPVEAHGEAPPKIAYGPHGTLYAVYNVGKVIPGERFPRSALRLVHSDDAGHNWSAPVTVTDGALFGSHSFEALHVASDGTIYVSWLGAPDADSASNTAPAAMTMTMAGGMSHNMSPGSHGKSTSWITRSTDGGKTWSPRIRVDMGEACPCCRTSLATTQSGVLYMAWRHIYPGSVRDIVVARSDDHGATWTTPVRVHQDDWKFDACPHAGPSLAVDSTGAVHIAWWTGKEGGAGVYYARSTDGGKTFATPIALGVAQYSQPAHVQLALANGNRVIVTWDDGTKQIPQVLLRMSNDGGAHFADALALSKPGDAASFPVLGVSGDSLAVAWSEESAQAAQAATELAAKTDRMAPKGLDAVGDRQVMMRRGVLRGVLQ